MRRDESGQLTEVKRSADPAGGMSSRRLVVFFLPLFAAGCVTAMLAALAALVGWHRELMLLVAAGIGIGLAIPTLAVVYREVADRRDAVRTLRDVQARVGGIVESAMDAIVTIDEHQRVVQFNPAAERVFRWPRAAVVGQRLDMLIPERLRASHARHVERFGATAVTSRGMGAQAVLEGLRADGEEFPIEASISQHVEDGRKLFTAILRDVSQRVRAEEALRKSQDKIQGLALAASTAREQEKSRIARELHDELGQSLTALKIDVSWLRENLGETAPEVGRKLAAMHTLLDGTVAAARRIAADLRPLMLDDLGLTAAAEWLAHNFTNRTSIACELKLGSGELDLPDPYATTVFRVLQECLTNVAKHAEATLVEVTIERSATEVLLTVRDNGRGFSLDAPPGAGSFGLIGLRERAYLVGGAVTIDSAPGQGTRVELRVPAPAPQPVPGDAPGMPR